MTRKADVRISEGAVGRGSGRTALVLGARPDSGNIGDAIASRLDAWGWRAIRDDCSDGDGSRPRGGIIPDPKIADRYGYSQGPGGHYQRFAPPSFDAFLAYDADDLIVTLGTTYKTHFAETPLHKVGNLIRANLVLPLECVSQFVRAAEHWDTKVSGGEPRKRRIVLIGSYAHRHPFTNGTLYCAAKAGLDMAAQTLGWELTDRGYRVHVVHPYHVNGTPMWAQVEKDVMESKGMTWEEADAYNRKDLKMPDLLTPPEVAEVVHALLAVPAMEWLSGTRVELNGGSR